ncbi:MAG: SdpI family protein [Deltaproteobacteria bacterium]|nr:SdpI family protein [Deltaproteobacteria bacterium]
MDLFTIYGLGPLFVLVSLPLALGKIPPNGLYGIRLPSIMEDPALWYPVNRGVGREMVYLGVAQTVVMLTIGLGASRWGVPQRTVVNIGAGLALVFTLCLVVRSLQWSRKVRAAHRDDSV